MTDAMFFVDELPDTDVVELTGAEAHHAATVKRIAIGEYVLLSDGRGNRAHAHAESVARDRVVLTVSERSFVPRPSPRFTVVQALPKGDRADLAVEILTELGVDEIVPWSASRSVSVWRDDGSATGKAAKGVAKWQRTAFEASKQSRRARVPVVADLASTVAVAERISRAAWAGVLHEAATEPLAAVAPAVAGELLIVIGPEGGVSDAELEAFSAAGAAAFRLGPEVLRTSTAGAAALAVLSLAVGRWR